MTTLEEELATVYELLTGEGAVEAAKLVREYPATIAEVGYDNWNGGTTQWEVRVEIPPRLFTQLGPKKEGLEKQITEKLEVVLRQDTQDWYACKIVVAKEMRKDWRAAAGDLPKQVRLNIIDGLRLEQASWYGRLDDVEFLGRLYDLQKLPSRDTRFKDAAGDIWQHRHNNDDWDDDWVFSDDRFGLTDGPAEKFLRFLCEMLHPMVRPDRDEVQKLLLHFNQQLRLAGWELYEEEHIAGRPRYASRRASLGGSSTISRARSMAEALDAGWMAKEIERVEQAVEKDPALAIGTAKDLIESCCKTILSKRRVEMGKTDDLGDLTKKLAKELRLVPEGIADETKGADNIRRILHNLTQLTNNLAQLRSFYGSGHGRGGHHRGLQPRHARLAVASAVAFIAFVTETYREQEAAKPAKSSPGA